VILEHRYTYLLILTTTTIPTIKIKNFISNTNGCYHHRLPVSWIINKKYTLLANGGWQLLPESSDNFYSSPLLSSYPFVRNGLLEYANTETANIGAIIRYKNILNGLFWNFSYNILWRKSDIMFLQNFEDTYIVSGIVRNPNSTKSEVFFANINYMLDFLKGGASLRGIYSRSNSYFMQFDVQQYSVSTMRQLSFEIYSSPFLHLDVDYTFSITNNSLQLNEKSNQFTNSMNQKLSLTFIPEGKLNIVVIGNHFLNTL